jgi:hypothetical protein
LLITRLYARETKLRTFLKSALFILVVSGLSAAAPGSNITDALPPETYAVVYSPDLPAARAAGADSAYGEILAEPEVKQFLESGFPSLSALTDDFRGVTGKSLREMLDFCKGAAAVAVLPDPNQALAVIAILDVGKEHKEFSDYIARNEARTGLAWTETEVPGATVKTAVIGSYYISHATAGQYFLVSNSNAAIETVTAGLLSGRKDSLSAEKGYVKCMSLAKLDNAQILAYANVALVLERLLDSLPPEMAPFVDVLGLKSIGAMSFSSRSQGKGFMDEFVYYFPTGREGLFAAVRPSTADPSKYLSMMPAASMSAAWATVDMKKFAAFANAFYDAIPPEFRGRSDEFLAGVKTETGVDLRSDLFAPLGDNFLSYAPIPSTLMGLGFSGGFGQGVFLVELSDQARFETTLDSLWKYAARKAEEEAASVKAQSTDSVVKPRSPAGPGGIPIDPKFDLSTEKFGKATIYKIKIVLNPSVQIVPAFATREGWLVLSLDPQSVKNALGAPLVFKPSLLNNRDYTAAAAVCGPGNSGASYGNNRALFDSVYPLVSIGLPFILAYAGGSMPADQILLPPADAISPHLFGSATATFVSPDSIRVSEYGPIGLVRSAYVIGTGAAALGKWLAASGAAPRAGQAQERPRAPADDLAVLKGALDGYATENGGAYPADPVALREHLDKSKEGGSAVLVRYRYVPGLASSDDMRLVMAFDRNLGPRGRRVLFIGGEMMNLTDEEVREQAGGWLSLPDRPTAAAAEAACLDNLRALAASVRRYADSHDGAVPAKLDLAAWYKFAPLVTSCQADDRFAGPDYATVGALNTSKVPEASRSSFVLVYETGPRHAVMAGAAFLDGTTRMLTPSDLKLAIEKTKKLGR